MKLKTLALGITFIAATSVTAYAQFAKPESAIKYRKSALTVMGTHFARLGAMAKGEVPFNKEEAMHNASIVNTMASLPWQAFGPNTEGGDALPAIWADGAKFKAAQEKLITAAANLNIVAQSGDVDALKKAVSATGGTCKGCHDDFRKK